MRREEGFVEFLVILSIFVVIFAALFVKWEYSEDLVSGIVYSNENNSFPAGNTYFKIRASEDTYVNKYNESSYCLPPDSPYIELVKEAAANKSIKVIVSTSKRFMITAPWVCMDNVRVERVK